ncbi:MAG: hypothetical protein JW889_04600 [Verrucomicrobia bacterium]|nr:hypothetical protein [Verrucomicrobiota bacterium]
MGWQRLRKKLRRWFTNLVILVVLGAIFGGLGYLTYCLIRYPKETKATIARLLGRGEPEGKPAKSTRTVVKPPPPPDEIVESAWIGPDGRPVPGVLQGRFDLAQFLHRGLFRIAGNMANQAEPWRLFDKNTETYVRINEHGPAQLVFEFDRPQVVTAVRLVLRGKNEGTFTLDCMEQPTVRTRPDLDERIHRVLVAGRPFKARRSEVVKFPRPVATGMLRLTLDKERADEPAFLAELEIHGRITISSVRAIPDTRRIVCYEESPVALRVRDDNGLVLDQLKQVAWRSSDPKVARHDDETGRIKGLSNGEAEITAEAYSKSAEPFKVVVHSPKHGPSGVLAVPFRHSVYLEWDPPTTSSWVAHYRIYRRTPKTVFTRRAVGRSYGAAFTDTTCGAGVTYHYRVEAINADGDVIGTSEETGPVTTSKDAARFAEVPSLDVLVLMYSEGIPKRDLATKRRGIEEAVRFYYRNTGGTLLLNCQYWDIPTLPPETDDRFVTKRRDIPDEDPGGEESPTMAYIEEDIAARGVEQDEFDVIYATGRGLKGNWGGFVLLGAGGAFGDPGTGGGMPITIKEPWKTAAGLTWIFCHEFHHAFDFVVIGDEPYDMYICHFYDNYPLRTKLPLDCGTHYDGIAQILRGYPREYYYNLKEPYRGRIEFLDSDSDGLPDFDPRFPIDEERFGSDLYNPDTDGDGLNDLSEFCAGSFSGTDPNNPDTDGDGLPDGQDKYPLYNRAEIIPVLPGGHVIDGIIELTWSRYTEGFLFTQSDESIRARIYANYDSDYLYFAIESNQKRSWFVELDASGEDGRWASPYYFSGADPSKPDEAFGDVWVEDAAFVVDYGATSITSKGKPVEGAKVACGIRTDKERRGLGYVIEIALPRRLPPGTGSCFSRKGYPVTEGLFLEPGKVFGINIYVNTLKARSQHDGDWGCTFDLFHLVDATLSGPEDLDGDGLNAALEAQRGTDPLDADTDHDGLIDSRDPTPTGERKQ